ncbi:hypothetical protein ACFY2W_19160 [Streptomyces sp. NPDC001262]|uniref:hypothetical protein n=1 Tax=Streptomyces sp. NPDC001262 TaxID=3364552 RepID=UPI0036C9C308
MTEIHTINLKALRAHCAEVERLERRIAAARRCRRELVEAYGAGTTEARKASHPFSAQIREDVGALHKVWEKFFEAAS